VSHCNPNQVTIFEEWLSKKFGVAVATHQGKVYNYLGMIFDFLAKGKMMVTMMDYIKNIIKDFLEVITGTKTSPAADHLFTVRDPSLAKALSEEQAMEFHRTKAQLLFPSARVQRDIQPATAFLTTRVRLPDEDNWGKVKRVLSYLRGTLHMTLILLADLLTLSRWWVDTAYAMHKSATHHFKHQCSNQGVQFGGSNGVGDQGGAENAEDGTEGQYSGVVALSRRCPRVCS
jgi:hypothetical protein